jgi:hypothetical protein
MCFLQVFAPQKSGPKVESQLSTSQLEPLLHDEHIARSRIDCDQFYAWLDCLRLEKEVRFTLDKSLNKSVYVSFLNLKEEIARQKLEEEAFCKGDLLLSQIYSSYQFIVKEIDNTYKLICQNIPKMLLEGENYFSEDAVCEEVVITPNSKIDGGLIQKLKEKLFRDKILFFQLQESRARILLKHKWLYQVFCILDQEYLEKKDMQRNPIYYANRKRSDMCFDEICERAEILAQENLDFCLLSCQSHSEKIILAAYTQKLFDLQNEEFFHRSIEEFSIGVPVKPMRKFAFKVRAAAARKLIGFLIA